MEGVLLCVRVSLTKRRPIKNTKGECHVVLCAYHCCLLAATIAAAGVFPLDRAWRQHVALEVQGRDTLNYVMDRETDMKIDLSGSLIEVKSGMIFDTSWKVKSVDADGTATIEQTVDRIQMKMDSPLGGGLDYDSKKPGSGNGQIWEMMGPMINRWSAAPLPSRPRPPVRSAISSCPKRSPSSSPSNKAVVAVAVVAAVVADSGA